METADAAMAASAAVAWDDVVPTAFCCAGGGWERTPEKAASSSLAAGDPSAIRGILLHYEREARASTSVFRISMC